MPLFFFDFRSEQDLEYALDDEGFQCADAPKARSLALTTLAEMAGELIADEPHRSISVRVRRQDNGPVFEATLSLAGRWLTEAGPKTCLSTTESQA